jgi:hypothetical protein
MTVTVLTALKRYLDRGCGIDAGVCGLQSLVGLALIF